MDKISVFCFAASYTVALLLELSRLFFRSGIRGVLLIGFACAGFLAQTLFVVARLAQESAQDSLDWYLLVAWILAAIYLYLLFYHPKIPLGIFLLPLILALIAFAEYLPQESGYPMGKSAWGMVHGFSLLLGTVIIFFGFIGGLIYLIQSNRLQRKRVPVRFRLPSLEWTEKITSRCIVLAAILLATGVLSGIALNAQEGDVPWSDPVVWSSGLLLLWLTAAMLFNVVYRPSRQGRKVAYLTLVSAVFLLLVLAVTRLVPSAHPTRQLPSANLSHTQSTDISKSTRAYS
ncbi:MAG: cytochrome c biogenesis protein CcsA [Planctomycetota bacterium]|nr:cytochrome c biogenesis protein CcsA [Planctomycetota bacterium]MEC8337258.1 cytochrome c biogenesis protein CcsA [Planctomycetota bacterium]